MGQKIEYEYYCPKCGEIFEVWMPMSEKASFKGECPDCKVLLKHKFGIGLVMLGGEANDMTKRSC